VPNSEFFSSILSVFCYTPLMFFRTKSIKGTPLVQLVESFRNSEGLPRQRVIASIGDANLPENEKISIARTIESRLSGYPDLFPPTLSPEAVAWVDRILPLASRQRNSNNFKTPSSASTSLAEEKSTAFSPIPSSTKISTSSAPNWSPSTLGPDFWSGGCFLSAKGGIFAKGTTKSSFSNIGFLRFEPRLPVDPQRPIYAFLLLVGFARFADSQHL